MNDKVEILLKKRYTELEMLGISPQLYFVSCKYINKIARVVIDENDNVFVFETKKNNRKRNNFITTQTISNQLANVLGVNKLLTNLIVNEWLRDSIITFNMKKDISKYWEYLNLPTEFSVVSDDFNF